MPLSKNQIIVFGFIFHVLAAIFSIGHHHADELFQVFEFAGYKLGINSASELPWEFGEQMRSGLQPLIVYAFTNVFHALSATNPFTIALWIRLFQSLFSFLAVFYLLRNFEKEIRLEHHRKFLWFFGLLAWCLPYFHARFSSENFSTSLFIFALVVLLNKKHGFIYFLPAGLLLGFCFITRFQMSFMILGLGAWLLFVQKSKFTDLVFLAGGLVLSVFVGVYIDQWLYGSKTLSWWNYLVMNVVEDKASLFGKSPVYFYITEGFLQLIPPFSILIICGLVVFWLKFSKHVLSWISLPFILLHFFVAHKELRFLFPMLVFIPIMLVLLYQKMRETDSQTKVLNFLSHKTFVSSLMIVNALLLLFFSFKPASESAQIFKVIYDQVEGKDPVLLYRHNDPYNNLAGLHYFRKPGLRTYPIDGSGTGQENLYFFSENSGNGTILIEDNMVFLRIYSNFPDWIQMLNFNGWVERSGTFSIYKKVN